MQRTDIRNVAIIAHVDHGKTTLVDAMLRQSGTFRSNEQVQERIMDSGDLERERGITILAKNTAIDYQGVKINIVDTPGHADFGGEVERILGMVDGVILVVDAFEGPMPQTRYVLRKALAQGLKPVVVINKIDRPEARPAAVVDEVLDLFISLIADDSQLDFPVIYASARKGLAGLEPDNLKADIAPILDAIIKTVPAPLGDDQGHLQIGISTLDYDDYVGRLAVGKILRGTVKHNQQVLICKSDGSEVTAKLAGLYTFSGLKRKEQRQVKAGELVSLVGLEDINIGDTVCEIGHPDPLQMLKVDEPTLSMNFMVNNSPFAGKEGQYVTSRHLRDRLLRETEKNVSLRVSETDSPDVFEVAGRGELHLSILIETMRREGYELQVSKPRVLTKNTNGVLLEPVEYLTIDLPEEYMGAVMELLGPRKAEMKNLLHLSEGQVRLEFTIPARGLIGFRSDFLTVSKGYGVMNHIFHDYEEYKGEIAGRNKGVLVAWEDGITTAYALHSIQDRGVLFINPGLEVYHGMIVGENNRDDDMDVNVCRKKHVTNIRAAGSDEALRLEPPRKMSLEQAMEFIDDDELVEITPSNIRLRKRVLDHNFRQKKARDKK
ncbi:MAG: translational GTPase TypA [Firmicutes bacterium]|nr:translational GTPase TypA [Bacillota bacterium]